MLFKATNPISLFPMNGDLNAAYDSGIMVEPDSYMIYIKSNKKYKQTDWRRKEMLYNHIFLYKGNFMQTMFTTPLNHFCETEGLIRVDIE